MALTKSTMLALGTKAPSFNLLDVTSGRHLTYQDIRGEVGTVVMFICNHCPYVIHINEMLVRLARKHMQKDIGFVAISSNDVVNYPEDAPDKMSIVAKVLQYPFAYLYDETQEVARAYDAACTPDLFVFDSENNLYYRGRLDGSTPGNGVALSGDDLRQTLEGLVAGHSAPEVQQPSMGCGIKWK